MTDTVGGALLAAIRHRSQALRLYLDALAVPRGVGRDSFTEAIKQFKVLASATDERAEYLAGRAVSEADAVTALRPLLAFIGDTTNRADQIFGRAGTPLPRSLVRSVTHEVRRIDVGGLRPLLAVGEPGNYETDRQDLWDFLQVQDVVPNAAYTGPHVRVFSIPPLEGARSLWTPIAVGHEVGHLAVHGRRMIERLGVASWLKADTLDVDTIPVGRNDWPNTREDRLRWLRNVLSNWTVEILCDLYGVYRFGPAGFAAQCDFLASVTADQDEDVAMNRPGFSGDSRC